jgi:glutaredoxin
MPHVTLYTKPGCHLCEAVEQVIAEAAKVRGFDFVVRNILDTPEDHERYRNAVPVVCVDGAEVARHRLSLAELHTALDRAGPQRPVGGSNA